MDRSGNSINEKKKKKLRKENTHTGVLNKKIAGEYLKAIRQLVKKSIKNEDRREPRVSNLIGS